MLFRLLPWLAFFGFSAFAAWPRDFGTGSSPGTDFPPPHPLAYFQRDPCLRPITDRMVRNVACLVATAEQGKLWAATHAEMTVVGKVGKLTVYDLWYRRGGHSYPYFDIRSVLVKTGLDLYREINVSERSGDSFPASEIVILDGEPVLIARSHDGGNHNRIDEALYMFRPTGLETPNFSAVGEAVAKLKPPDMSFVIDKSDYDSMTYTLELYKNDTGLPRVAVKERGRITVSYRFVDGRAIVTESKYEPYSQ